MAIRDIERAFPDVPDAVTGAIYRGFEMGRRREKLRKAAFSVLATAAVLVVTAAGLWGGMRLNSNQDKVAAPAEKGVALSGISRVYTGREDIYFHAGPECAGGVEMSLEAARGFGKMPCPDCLEGVKE